MITISIYRKNTTRCNSKKKDVVTVFDLGGYIGIGKDFSEQLYHHYLTEKKEEKPRRVIPRKRRKRDQQKSF